MRLEMGEQQRIDLVRRLIRGKVADTGQDLEPIRPRHVIGSAFGGGAPDGVVGVAPDVERRHRVFPSGLRIAPRARYHVSAASIVAASPSTATCRSIASSGTLLALSRSRNQRESSARSR